MTLIDTELAAYVLGVTIRQVQHLVKDGTLANHNHDKDRARRILLDLAEVSRHAARKGD